MVRQIPVCSFLLTVVLCVAGTQCLPFPRNINLKGTQSRNLSITCIMRPANRDIHAVKRRAAPQALGYRCAHCTSEFDSKTGMDCHRRHPTSQGTPCADPENSKSLSFSGRANVASSLLRQHDTLGATAIDQPTFHVYIVAVCYIIIMIISKIICIIAIICLT